MITVTTTQTRPSVDVEFYISTVPVVRGAFLTLANTTDNLLEPATFTLSPDGLTHTSIAKFESRQKLDAFLQEMDQMIPGFFQARDRYSREHGIIIERVEA